MKTGHYFEFKRGTWYTTEDNKIIHQPTSGLSYVGWLTLDQQKELDTLISQYLDKVRPKG